MKILAIALLLCCISPIIGKSQTSQHPARNNYIKLYKGDVLVGEGVFYDLTDSAFVLYDDSRLSKHDTIFDKSLLKSYSYRDVQLVKINFGSGLGSLMIGGLIGGAAGSVIGYGIAEARSNDEGSIDRSHDQVVGFIIGFIIGGVGGAIPGYVLGNKHREQVLINYDYWNFTSQKDNLKLFCFKK
jgi:hypothetical protein